MPLRSEAFDEWVQHPVTRALREKWATRRREALKERWASGEFTGSFSTEMAVKNAGATGAASAYLELIELDFESLITELEDGEYVRIEAAGASGADSPL